MKVAVVVPTYNEEERVVDVILKILSVVNKKCIVIVVDDGSVDDSLDKLKKQFNKNKRVIILNHCINLGKGSSMKTGVMAAWKLGIDTVVFIDADGQHDPKYINQFIDKLNEGPVVFGYRLLQNNVPWLRRIGNRIADWVIKIFFNIKRKDSICGFWGFRKDVYQKIKWKSCRYEVETEVATRVAKQEIPFSEIKIDTIYIDKYKGVTIFDALKILLKIPCWFFDI